MSRIVINVLLKFRKVMKRWLQIGLISVWNMWRVHARRTEQISKKQMNRMKVVWCHFLLLMFWTTFRSLVAATEGPSSESHDVDKRSTHMYSFGLGKKSAALSPSSSVESPAEAESSSDSDGGPFDSESEDYFDARDTRDPGRYAFGLGKRDRDNRFAFGLGKRPDQGSRFAFGLGKRPEHGHRFAFGLGKRPDTRHRFAFGLGKRKFMEDSDEATKRFIPDIEDYMKRRYSFGLGKRTNRYAFGLGRKKREPISSSVTSTTTQSEST